MKKALLLCLSILFLLPPMNAQAAPPPVPASESQSDELTARRLERARRRARQRLKRRLRRTDSSRRPRRRFHNRPPVRRVVVAPSPSSGLPDFTNSLALGLRLTAAEPAGSNLGLSTANQPIMGGAGLQLRARLSPRLGTEVTLDALQGEVGTMVQTTVPVMAAAVYYPLPQSRIQPYGLLGAGVHLTTLSSGGLVFQRDVTEFAGQAGAGLEIFLSRHFSVHADLRGHGVVVDPTARGRMMAECVQETGSSGGVCAPFNGGGHKITLGAQVSLGTSFYF